jgi:Tfp pilus assembly protein PilX
MNAQLNVMFRRRQSGAALLVSLVLIFMLTVLGISAMRGATLENQLASNASHKQLTFQAAESAADSVLAIDDITNEQALENIICVPDPVKFNLTKLSAENKVETSVELQYGGQSLPTGWTLGGPVGGRRFVVTGESTIPGASTSTRIAQGVVAVGAVQEGVDC